MSLSCCCFPLPPGTTSLPVFVYLSVRLFFLADDNAAMQITVSSSSSVCVFYLIHRPTSQHTHTLAPAAFPLFLTHTHTQNQKKDDSGFCANCVTHKSEAWPPAKILWGPRNLVKKNYFGFLKLCVCVCGKPFFCV